MKFLLFNIVVAVALVFLFNSDRSDLHALADKAHDVASAAKETIRDSAKPVAEKVVVAAPDRPSNIAMASASRVSVRQAVEGASPGNVPSTVTRHVATGPLDEAKTLPADVSKRRAEVLGDIAIPQGPGKMIDVDVRKFMSGRDRRRDLMQLSEEMELFSAEAIGR